MCEQRILKELDAGTRSCECGEDCSETDYEIKTSSSLWPSRKYEVCTRASTDILPNFVNNTVRYQLNHRNFIGMLIILQETAKSLFGYDHLMVHESGFKNNFAQIGVYYQSLNTKLTKEEAKYNVINFRKSYIIMDINRYKIFLYRNNKFLS